METTVQLLCPTCTKAWDSPPKDLPELSMNYECPDCGERRNLSEFLRTERDLETLKQLT